MNKKNKDDATKKKAVRVDSEEHEELLEEISRRTALEHDEVVDESSDDSEGEESGEEGEDEGV